MKRIHLIISGDVHGVGYRVWAKKQAKDLGISGWVKNRDDKSVELVAEGQQTELEALIKRCKRGPDVAWVERVDVQWLPPTGEYMIFEVLY